VDVLVGIDMGTGSTKGVLTDASGSVLASETVAHSMDLPRPGWAEVDAEGLWWREICDISAKLMAALPSGANVAGVCISGVGPCLVLCDDDLQPLRPAILYGIDTRATAEIDSLTEELGCAGDTRSGRHVAVEPGGRPEAGVGIPQRASGFRARHRLLRVQLVHRCQAHR
jgi:xylulokinase